MAEAKAKKTKITASVMDFYGCEEGAAVDLWGVSFTREGDQFVAEIDEDDAKAMIKAKRAAPYQAPKSE